MRVAPKKSLGQHFLVDENILGVIGRLAELGPDDVVLEIGPGLGVLTRYLAERVAHVHAVELDRVARAVPARHRRRTSRSSSATRCSSISRQLDATKLVANLPYNIATPLLVESLDGLPGIELWCVMVQREVADRLFAVPSTKAYGAVSVLVQLVCERTGLPSGLAHRLPAAAERRLGARRVPARRAAGRLRAREAHRRRRVRAPPQDVAELARARGRSHRARARPRRSTRSAAPRRRAPRRSRRRSSSRSPTALA